MAKHRNIIAYGAVHRSRRAALALGLVAASALVLGLLAIGLFWPGLRERAVVELKYRRCLAYSPAPDRVAYTMDSTEAETLLRAGHGYNLHHGLETRSRKAVFYPPVLEAYNRHFSASRRPLGGVAFLHGRRPSHGGEMRLVAVEVSAWRDLVAFGAVAVVGPKGVRPKGFGGADLSSKLHKNPPAIKLHEGDVLRVFEGQPDGSDPSRFTIDLEMNGVRNSLEGRLRSDGSVELRPLTGRLVHYGGQLDRAWCPDGSNREPSGLDSPVLCDDKN